jgi:hypothetical protein
MRLAAAAKYFDKTVCADAYTPFTAFYGQLNLFDDSMRDGTTVVRRVLSVDDAVTIPARKTITIHGDTFIIGGDHEDSYGGSVIRRKYVVHRADGVANVRTINQALNVTSATNLFAARLWVKDLKELEISSRLGSFMNIYVASNETVAVGSVVYLSSRWHIVRNTFIGAAGFLVLEADELPADALTTCSYTRTGGGVYDPAADIKTGATSTVAVLTHRWQDDYVYLKMSADRFADGDIVAHISKTAITAAEAGDSFVLSSVTYRVVSVRDDGLGAWNLHCRRA